ncbi:MAG: hypothetical protein AAFN17_05845 [Pseudomonadota bacterium]
MIQGAIILALNFQEERKMTVSLRIVGIFFSDDAIPFTADLDTPAGPRMSVAAILAAARDRAAAGTNTTVPANLFTFTTSQLTLGPDAGKKTISAFVARYTSGPTSVTSHITYRDGEFFLSEDLASTPSYSVWQYYVFDKPLQEGGTYIPNSPRIQSYETAGVPDGGMVTWRLIQILAGRNEVPGFLRPALLNEGKAV